MLQKSWRFPYQLMQPIPRHCQVSRTPGGVEVGQGDLNPLDLISAQPATVSPFIQPFQTAVAERPNHK